MEELFSAFFGAVLGSLLTSLAQFYFAIRSQNIEQITDFIADIERIEKLSTQYWLNSSKSDHDKQMDIAAQIRGALHASTVFFGNGKSLLAGDWDKFQKLDGRLFDLTTGDTFETKQQVKDWSRVVEIMKCVNEIRHLMRGARGKMFWAR